MWNARKFADVIEDARIGIQVLVLILGKVVRFHVVADLVFAFRHRFGPPGVYERRLSGSVHAHQRDPIATLNHEVYVAKYQLWTVALGDIFELRDDATAGFWLRKREVDGLLLGRNLDPLDLLQFLDAALDLLRLGSLVTEAVDKDFQLLDALALIAISGFKLFAALGFFRQILVIVAGVEVDPLIPDSTVFLTVTSRKYRSCEISTNA